MLNQHTQILILFRGLPGAGKTTIARTLCQTVLSADDYFVQPDGSYRFDPDAIAAAHRQCLSNAAAAIRLGIARIAIANTFTTIAEMDPYFRLAHQHGIAIASLIVENYHGSESVHDVPEDVFLEMRDRFKVSLGLTGTEMGRFLLEGL